MKLTVAEIDILIKAVDDWTNSGLQSYMIQSVASIVVAKSKGDQERMMDEAKVNMERDKAAKDRTAIMLKAKLPQMRDEAEIEEAKRG